MSKGYRKEERKALKREAVRLYTQTSYSKDKIGKLLSVAHDTIYKWLHNIQKNRVDYDE